MKLLLIPKGILLYSTFILAMLYIGSIDSIYDEGYFAIATAVVAGLIYLCKKTISSQELDKLLFSKGNEDEFV